MKHKQQLARQRDGKGGWNGVLGKGNDMCKDTDISKSKAQRRNSSAEFKGWKTRPEPGM